MIWMFSEFRATQGLQSLPTAAAYARYLLLRPAILRNYTQVKDRYETCSSFQMLQICCVFFLHELASRKKDFSAEPCLDKKSTKWQDGVC